MPANTYSFATHWHVPAPPDLVSAILADATQLPRWWPSVYLDATLVDPGAPGTHLGREVALHTRGWLPYTLRWRFRVVENRHPHGFTFEVRGDFGGSGVWSFTREDGGTHVRFDWNVVAEKPLLRSLSFVLRPIFRANHAWAMRRGRECLRREIERRRGQPQ